MLIKFIRIQFDYYFYFRCKRQRNKVLSFAKQKISNQIENVGIKSSPKLSFPKCLAHKDRQDLFSKSNSRKTSVSSKGLIIMMIQSFSKTDFRLILVFSITIKNLVMISNKNSIWREIIIAHFKN